MVTTVILTASVLLDIAPRGQNPLCEAREGVEIYVVEDMVDGPEIVAPYRVVEVIRGEEAETLTLRQMVSETMFGFAYPLSVGTRRLVYVKDGTILRAHGCGESVKGSRGPDIERFPGPPHNRQDWRDDAFEMHLRFVRAYVRFEREPRLDLLIEMLTSDDLPTLRAAIWLLRRINLDQPEVLEPVGQTIVERVLEELPMTENRRVYFLESPCTIESLKELVRFRFTLGDRTRTPPTWVDGLTEIYLRLEQGEGRGEGHAGATCRVLQDLGVVQRCDRGPDRGLLPEDRQRLKQRFDIEPGSRRPQE